MDHSPLITRWEDLDDLGNAFFRHNTEGTIHKRTVDKLYSIKIRNFCSEKDHIKRIRGTTDKRKIFAKDTSDKRRLKMYKELLKINSKKPNNPIKKWAKDLNRHLIKMIYRWKISIWKDASHYISSGKCKLNKRWGTTTHLSEWPKSRTLTTPNADKHVEQWELSYIAGGNAKWYSYFERVLGGFL